MTDIVTMARAAQHDERLSDGALYGELADEIERLRERLGPRGLEVVMIGGTGHYVNEKVKAEIERLRKLVPPAMRETPTSPISSAESKSE